MWVAYIFKLRHLVADVQSKKLQMMVGDEGITVVHQLQKVILWPMVSLMEKSKTPTADNTTPSYYVSFKITSVTLVL